MEEAKANIKEWLIDSAELFPERAEQWSTSLVESGITSVTKISSRLDHTPDFLTALGINDFEAADIKNALAKHGDGIAHADNAAEDRPSSRKINKSVSEMAKAFQKKADINAASANPAIIAPKSGMSVAEKLAAIKARSASEHAPPPGSTTTSKPLQWKAPERGTSCATAVPTTDTPVPPTVPVATAKVKDSNTAAAAAAAPPSTPAVETTTVVPASAAPTGPLAIATAPRLPRMESGITSSDDVFCNDLVSKARAAIQATEVVDLVRETMTNKDKWNINDTVPGECFKALTRLCYAGGEHKDAFAKQGACTFVPNLMAKYTDSVFSIEHGLRAIVTLCHGNAHNKQMLGKAGACGLVVTALQNHGMKEENKTLADHALKAIASLAADPENNEKHLGAACGVIEELLKTYGTIDANIAEQSLRAIVNLAMGPANKLKLGTASMCTVLTAVMESQGKENSHVAQQAFWAIGNIGLVAETKTRLGECGLGSSILVSTMQHHGIEDEALVEQFIRTLCIFAMDKPNRTRIGAAGGCTLLVDILFKYHEHKAQVAEQGMKSMLNLAINPDNKRVFGDNNACALAKVVLHYNTDNDVAITVEHTLRVISSLSINPANQVKLHGEGIAATLQATLSRYCESNVGITEHALRAVANLACFDGNNTAFNEVGLCATVVKCMSVLGKSTVGIAECALRAVVNMAVSDDNKSKLGEDGACEAVMDLLQTHAKSSAVVAEQGLRSIVNLAVNTQNKEKLGRNVNVVALMSVIEYYYKADNAAVTQQGLRAIINLAVNAENKDVLGASGACDIALDCLKHASSATPEPHSAEVNETVALASTAIFNLMVKSSENRKRFIDRRALEELIKCQEMNSFTEATQTELADALAALRLK